MYAIGLFMYKFSNEMLTELFAKNVHSGGRSPYIQHKEFG